MNASLQPQNCENFDFKSFVEFLSFILMPQLFKLFTLLILFHYFLIRFLSVCALTSIIEDAKTNMNSLIYIPFTEGKVSVSDQHCR